ncbi:hypothetical protein HAPAU_07660 [Halalkalicoccus paucihalophilus]|uniref:DUF424 domain-containing protein n=1 Tax=Halalkalicoccus paucihalophilus TaxID=1008153 RepID=A0A151AGT2_9EURY|nr:DUF424 family protein [Halalkalicoccus paucihalophilus]KYH26879.1 hypothetical protein HAPAU_07660 [Halalkalicoccus paucihalophilus]
MILTERQTPKGLLVSVCDRNVLGETFENGDVSITVTEEFYGGEEADESEVAATLARASVANLVGERAVALAIERGHVDETNVLDIDGTPHAQFLRM